MADFPSRDREAFYAHWAKILGDNTCSVRTVLLGDEVAGNVCAWGPPKERLVGYWIGKRYWGQGVASRALASFLDVERTRPLHAHVALHNAGSIRVLEKCGFAPLEPAPDAARAAESSGERVFVLVRPA
jgi:RimJ/RimL family protein N-acetyltransferase